MTNNCLQELTEGQNRLYRLLDTALNGTQYAELPDGEISPAIPAVPPAGTTEANALRAQAARLWQLAENAATAAEFTTSAIDGGPALDETTSWAARLLAVQGTTPGGWFGVGAKPVQLLDLLKAGRVNDADDKSKIGQAIDQVDSALDVGTDLGTFIKGFLDSAAELGTDGGLIAVQLALGAANARVMQRIYTALDGGGLLVPSDEENNLLTYARKAAMNDAGTASSGQLLADILDALGNVAPDPQVVTLLTEISTRIGPTVGGSGTNAQLASMLSALRSIAGLEAAGTIAAGSALRLQLDILECICEAVNGPPTPTPSIPPWEDVICPDNPLLTATFTFTGDVGSGILASGLTLNGTPPNWSTDPGDELSGPLLLYGNTQISACFVVAVDPSYTGTVAAGLTPILLEGYSTAARPGTPVGGTTPTDYTHFREDTIGTEAFIGYNCSINVTPGDPPLDGSQVRVYIGRPDPEA